jgi:hypothetical protein
MGLEVYYPADICNALLAAEQAVNATALATGNQDDPFTSGYLTGYRAALTTLALAFGLAAKQAQALSTLLVGARTGMPNLLELEPWGLKQ